MRALIILALLACSVSGGSIDLDTPPKPNNYIDAFGGDPVLKNEIGAVVQARPDPEIEFPKAGSCRDDGIQPTVCSQQCLFSCETPQCSASCLCACDTSSAKAALVSELKVQRDQMHREMQLLAVQAQLWEKSLKGSPDVAFKAHAKHKIHALVQQHATRNEGAKRLSAAVATSHRAQAAMASRRGQAAMRNQLVDPSGFNWDKMSQEEENPWISHKDMMTLAHSAYAKEANIIDGVYDPTEDPNNIGRPQKPIKGMTPYKEESTNWWAGDTAKSMGDEWWNRPPAETHGAGASR